jgi:hypothetical protein
VEALVELMGMVIVVVLMVAVAVVKELALVVQ